MHREDITKGVKKKNERDIKNKQKTLNLIKK